MKKLLAGIGIGIIGIVSIACGNNETIIEQPTIQSGNQSEFTCVEGIVHMDDVALDYDGTSVKVEWAAPRIGMRSMVKELYCSMFVAHQNDDGSAGLRMMEFSNVRAK